jgi:hypothetical protein
MKKLLVVVVLTVCLGLVGGVFADQASAFFGNLFGGGKACGSGYGYGMPYCGPNYYVGSYAPAWGCKAVTKKKKAAAPAEKKAKPAPAKKK